MKNLRLVTHNLIPCFIPQEKFPERIIGESPIVHSYIYGANLESYDASPIKNAAGRVSETCMNFKNHAEFSSEVCMIFENRAEFSFEVCMNSKNHAEFSLEDCMISENHAEFSSPYTVFFGQMAALEPSNLTFPIKNININ
jgi:hypothetical protein